MSTIRAESDVTSGALHPACKGMRHKFRVRFDAHILARSF